MTGSQCCTAEIGINTVNQLYFNKKKSLGISIYKYSQMIFFFFFFFFFFFLLCRAAPVAYGGPQARGQIIATAATPCHSCSNTGSEPCLQPIPRLTATPDPLPSE